MNHSTLSVQGGTVKDPSYRQKNPFNEHLLKLMSQPSTLTLKRKLTMTLLIAFSAENLSMYFWIVSGVSEVCSYTFDFFSYFSQRARSIGSKMICISKSKDFPFIVCSDGEWNYTFRLNAPPTTLETLPYSPLIKAKANSWAFSQYVNPFSSFETIFAHLNSTQLKSPSGQTSI